MEKVFKYPKSETRDIRYTRIFLIGSIITSLILTIVSAFTTKYVIVVGFFSFVFLINALVIIIKINALLEYKIKVTDEKIEFRTDELYSDFWTFPASYCFGIKFNNIEFFSIIEDGLEIKSKRTGIKRTVKSLKSDELEYLRKTLLEKGISEVN